MAAQIRRELTGTVLRAYPCWPGTVPTGGAAHQTLEAELTEDASTGTGASADDAVLLFVGGPLDGRVEIRAARHGDPLPTVTHVHLHGGPKVVHRYDLEPLTEGVGVYNLRPPARKPARDESAAAE
ncbi:hypothetical protein ACI78T_05975 [Blastococcus sp. SYSU D00922]